MLRRSPVDRSTPPSGRGVRQKLAASLLVFGACACGTITVTSTPQGAEVALIQPGQDKGNPIGTTPFTSPLSTLTSKVGDGPIILQVRKPGFQAQNFVVPDVSGARLKLATVLPQVNSGAYIDINRIVRLTLQAERQILQNQLDEAIATAVEIRKINENVTSAWEIEGTAQLMKGDFARSRLAWQRSLEIDGDNPDALHMIQLVDEKLGIKK
jgi:hypothetical protein